MVKKYGVTVGIKVIQLEGNILRQVARAKGERQAGTLRPTTH
jgi:hypothetical protein